MKVLTSLFFLFVTSILFTAFAQQKADSAAVSSYFMTLETKPISDSITNKIAAFKKTVLTKDLDQYYYHYSKYLLVKGEIDKAKSTATEGIENLGADTLSLKSIKLYNLLAASYSMQKEYVNAIKYFNRSIKISENFKNKVQSAYLQNNVANIFFSIQDYESAYEYAFKSYNNIKGEKNDPYRLQILSVLSVAEAKIGETNGAKIHAMQALNEANKIHDSVSMIVALYSLGDVALSDNEFQNAKSSFSKSLEMSENLSNYNYVMLNSIGLMNALITLKEYKEAVEHGEKGLAIATALQNDNTLYSIKKNLANAYYGTGNLDKAFKMLTEAHEIFKESTSAERQKSINDILIKYDTEKKEKRLATKNIQLLEKDIEASRFFQIILVLAFVLVLVITFFIFHRQKTRQREIRKAIEYEKSKLLALISGEEEERIRISNELHDGLASSLTAVRYKLENTETRSIDEKNELIALLKQTHEETRRIAHNLSPLMLETYGLFKSIEQFAAQNQNSKSSVQVFLTGNDSLLQKSAALIIYRFTQELVQNAIKYSEAKTISINLVCSNEQISLMVEDDGVGFDLNEIKSKGGHLNITSRVHSLHGTIEIDSMLQKGTVIHINLPVSL